MRRVMILAIHLCVAASGAAAQADPDKEMRALNNFVHQHIECAAFYVIGSQCLATRPDSAELSKNLRQSYEAALRRGIEYGNAIKLAQKTHEARLEMAMTKMMSDMEKNCINVSVILNSHALVCKRLMDEPMEALERIRAGKSLKD
jgi:hypothetical protein